VTLLDNYETPHVFGFYRPVVFMHWFLIVLACGGARVQRWQAEF
jgi:hypothetical protein